MIVFLLVGAPIALYPSLMHELRSLISTLVALGALVFAFVIMSDHLTPSPVPIAGVATSTLSASAASSETQATSSGSRITDAPSATRTDPLLSSGSSTPKNKAAKPQNDASAGHATRIDEPYRTAPLSFDTVNTDTRAALVNIFCTPQGGSLSPISGSGVVIDPRGVILTNAHVAQYVLLSESPQVNLTCAVRTGAPASPSYRVSVLYLPEVWVAAHAKDILTLHPTGTGEHDWALLRASGPLPSGTVAFPSSFPFLSYDIREGIAFMDDQVLAAGYPAEFVGGIIAQTGLYPVSSISKVDELLTLSTSTVDLISIGGVVEAQSGSSGGPVVNQWDKLVGIITTTSEGTTTAQRDLRALTLNYIDRDMAAQTGLRLTQFLGQDLLDEQQSFDRTLAPGLLNRYLSYLSR